MHIDERGSSIRTSRKEGLLVRWKHDGSGHTYKYQEQGLSIKVGFLISVYCSKSHRTTYSWIVTRYSGPDVHNREGK